MQMPYYYLSFVSLAIVIMVIYIALKYMAAKLFKIPEWEAYVSVELYELFLSVIIMVAVFAFFEAGSAASSALTGEADPIKATQLFLLKILHDVHNGINDIFSVQICLSVLNTFHKRPGEAVLTVTFKIFPGIDSLVSLTNIVGYGLIIAFGSLFAQITLLTLIDATMKTFFLPIGILLRFFPQTREAGVFLIVFALAAQIVLPTTYLLNKKIMEDIGLELPFYKSQKAIVASICGAKYALFGLAGHKALIGGIPIIGTLFNAVFAELGINLISPLEFKEILQEVAKLSLPSLFLPAFSTVITFAFINALTKFILAKM